MLLLGLEFPLPSHAAAVRHVLAATAATIGFGIGGWLLDSPLDRGGAVALFVAFLYILLADPFLSMKDARSKRYMVASGGAGILVASAAIMEQLFIFH
jgi:hypothetical protein